jgi:hypothetical protein
MWSIRPSPLKTGKLDAGRKVFLIIFYGKKMFGNYSCNFGIYKAIFLKVDETRSGYSIEDKQCRF